MRVIASPKKLVMGTSVNRGCNRKMKVRVRGPKLESNESMSLWTTATVVKGAGRDDAGTEYTFGVIPGKVKKIFPSDSGNICNYLYNTLTSPGNYKIKLNIEAVVRSGITIRVATKSVTIKVKYTGFSG